MQTLLVTDANILIDLATVGEFDLLFLPAYRIKVTYEVFYELRTEQLTAWQLHVQNDRMDLEEVDEEVVQQLRTAGPPRPI